MVNGKKVIVVTPSGRQKCLQILANHILKARKKGVVDEWHLWQNTTERSDIKYIKSLARQFDFISVKTVEPDHPMTRDWRQWNLHLFYKHCQDPDAVYIRIDDDIVWMEDDAIEKLADYRTRRVKPFIIYPNILNNCLMSSVLVRMGVLPTKFGIPKYLTFNNITLENGLFAKALHEQVIEDIENGDMEKYKFKLWMLHDFEHHSITVSSFMDMKWRNGELGPNDEIQLNVDIPKEIGVANVVYGEPIFVHWQYHHQRMDLENRGLDPDMFLKEYLKLSLK